MNMTKIVVVFLAMSLTYAQAFAASDRCVVKESAGRTVVLECNKKAGNFKVDDRVKVKTAKRKPIEGC